MVREGEMATNYLFVNMGVTFTAHFAFVQNT